MRVAVVGGGISGMAAAHTAQSFADVTLFEAAPRLGGHTDTHNLLVDDRAFSVDSGFIIFNRSNYPLFSAWLDALGVASQPTEMSFGVRNADGFEYGTSSLDALFCQRRNVVRLDFMRMLADIRRFYRSAGSVAADDSRTLDAYLRDERYSNAFAEHHLLPMCAALWSAPHEEARKLAVGHVAVFMVNHGLTLMKGRPEWRVVRGGSGAYIRAFVERFGGQIRRNCMVRSVREDRSGVLVATDHGSDQFDHVILACHSDDACKLIEPTHAAHDVLSAIAYQPNRAVLHSDARVMPRSPAAWSSWNVYVDAHGQYEFTYWMNRLQGLASKPQFFVTLNPVRELSRVWVERNYRHPIFSVDAHAAKRRLSSLDAGTRISYCGAWTGWGFHEDGFRSGVEAAAQAANTANVS
ncbi:MAG: FAD-dependent oxidoreductase [Gammaproteobacteria bacterium]|nr:FAD-dependent oxidoreductase [Gammaproteobacteria bacterium]